MSPEPIDTETVLELYLTDKENELSEASLQGHKYRLGHFVRWCTEQEIGNLKRSMVVISVGIGSGGGKTAT